MTFHRFLDGVSQNSGDGKTLYAAFKDVDSNFQRTVPFTSAETFSVGSGYFSTINEALTWASRKGSSHFNGRITLHLVAGFEMSEQVLVDGLDLSWITITGADSETTIVRSALSTNVNTGFPAFFADNGGVLPVIGQLFNMNNTGSGANRHGVFVRNKSGSITLPGCGVKNAGEHAFYALEGSWQNNQQANGSGAGQHAFFAESGSWQNNQQANGSEAGGHAFRVREGSIMNAMGATNIGSTSPAAMNTTTASGIIFVI